MVGVFSMGASNAYQRDITCKCLSKGVTFPPALPGVFFGEKTMTTAKVKLTNGNIKNSHFYLTSCLSMFPTESVGGRNKFEQGRKLLKIKPLGDEEIETDIDGTKNIFRKRGWVTSMFKRANAKQGDHVFLKKHEDGTYHVWVESAGTI